MKAIIIGAAVALAPALAWAQSEPVTEDAGERLSYTYIQAGYAYDTRIDPNKGSSELDGDGYDIQASFDISPTMHLLGAFNETSQSLEGSDSGEDRDLQRIRAGIGFHSESGANADTSLFANFTYERYDLADAVEGDGFGAEAGIRYGFTGAYTSRLELDVSLQYIDLREDALLDNQVGLRAALLYDLTQRFALFLTYEDNQILKESLVGVRAYF